MVNGKIYAIGTIGIAEYDPTADTWTFKEPMPTNRSGFALAVYQNKIYVIGGSNGLNQVYDPATETWENRASMTTPRAGIGANVVNGKIYVIGGQDEFHDSMNLDLTQIYDPETNTWSYGAPIPNVIWHAAAGATTGEMAPTRIYIMGGLPGGGGYGTDLNQIYDPATDTWVFGVSMPIARAGLHVAVVNDVLYVMGGFPFFNFQATWLPENYQYTPIGYIPEFPSWIILPLFLTATLVIVIFRKRLKKGVESGNYL